MDQRIEDADTGQVMAEAAVVLVAYDYPAQRTILVPENWREKITAFEREMNERLGTP